MSDPQPVPGRRTPPRADPLQPDKPGPDMTRDETDGSKEERSGQTRRRQSEDALKNVNTGYG